MTHTFHPPNRVPENHDFIFLAAGCLRQREAVQLIHSAKPEIYIACLAESPPFHRGRESEVFNAWSEYHLRSAWNRGVALFWLDQTGTADGDWVQNQFARTLREYHRLFHTRRQVRVVVGIDPRLQGIRQGFQQTNPDLILYASLPDVCRAAANMLCHCYNAPRLAASR